MRSHLHRFGILTILLTIFFNANAYDFTSDRIYFNILSEEDRTVEVTFRNYSYSSYSGNIEIPQKVINSGKTYKVIQIGYKSFKECKNLTSITIPNSVSVIGEDAFIDCSSLASITIPNSVTTIGSGAFYQCSSLASVTIPNSVTTIGSSAFLGCSSLVSVTIPNSVTTIEEGTFNYCSSLVSVTIPESVINIRWYNFKYCHNLESIEVAESNPNYASLEGILYNKFKFRKYVISEI